MAIKYVRKVALLIFACAALLMLPVGSLGVNAGNKLPTGGLSIAPDVNNLGIIEITDEEAGQLDEPAVLNGFAASTGEHYEQLSDEEKIWYVALYNAVTNKKYIPYSTSLLGKDIRDFEEYEYVIETSTTKSNFDSKYNEHLNRAKQALYFDHPDKIEFFMCWPLYLYRYINGNTTTFCFILRAFYDDTKFATVDNQITTGLNSFLSEIRHYDLEGENGAITERNVHDYYTKSIMYDYACAADTSDAGAFNLSHTAWGSLYHRYCVCDGYATGFEMIMDSLEIDSMVIAGEGDGGSGWEGHAWNIVELDGDWYEVDTTWADEIDFGAYFNKTTAEFNLLDHRRPTTGGFSGFRMPVAEGTTYTRAYIDSIYSSSTVDIVEVPLESISLAATAESYEIGDEIMLIPEFSPVNATYRSYLISVSNPAVLGITGNIITAKSAGTATVTIKSVKYNDIKVTRSITVNEPKQEEEKKEAEKEAEKEPEPKKIGTTIKVKTSGNTDSYKVTSSDGKTVSYTKAGNKNATSITIPSAVTDENGVTYTVTEIESNALKNLKKLKKLTIPATIKKIGKNAFKNTTKLKTLKVYGYNLATVKNSAFTGMNSSCKITIYCKNKTKYNKLVRLFKKAGAKKQKYTFKKKK